MAEALPAAVRLPAPIRALTWSDVGHALGPEAGQVAPAPWRWLVPAAAVLEVLRCGAPRPLVPPLGHAPVLAPALAAALLGVLPWRERQLPLLRLSAATGDTGTAPAPAGAARLRAVICPTLDPACGLEAIAFAAHDVPALVVLRDGEPAPEPPPAPGYACVTLRLSDQRFAVPDLDAIGAALAPLARVLDQPADPSG
ncbi:hypothetical protein [uncultured Thiohalocapsa sp.]|uniref:hypothetical protein n=1 Tax=uncultured Thiohalocapsa sp. TaxID=768990 RepID=UPI0025D9659D|nr:hypothetical protein [uncultured Thiohalocapsa sp.]